jgi:hypothetical protein
MLPIFAMSLVISALTRAQLEIPGCVKLINGYNKGSLRVKAPKTWGLRRHAAQKARVLECTEM